MARTYIAMYVLSHLTGRTRGSSRTERAPETLMPKIIIRYRSDRPQECLEADDARLVGQHVELVSRIHVMNRPRDTVVRRVLSAEVLSVHLESQSAPVEPQWAAGLGPCWPVPLGGACPVRQELLEISELLRQQLLLATSAPGGAGSSVPERQGEQLRATTTLKALPEPTGTARQRWEEQVDRLDTTGQQRRDRPGR